MLSCFPSLLSLLALCSLQPLLHRGQDLNVLSCPLRSNPRLFETATESTDGREDLVICQRWRRFRHGAQKKGSFISCLLPRTPTVDELLLFHTGAPELVVQYGALWWEEGRSCLLVEREEDEGKVRRRRCVGEQTKKRKPSMGMHVSFVASRTRERGLVSQPRADETVLSVPRERSEVVSRLQRRREKQREGRFSMLAFVHCIVFFSRSPSSSAGSSSSPHRSRRPYLVRVHVGRRWWGEKKGWGERKEGRVAFEKGGFLVVGT